MKIYNKPKLIIHGSVEKLTQMHKGGGSSSVHALAGSDLTTQLQIQRSRIQEKYK